MLYFETRQLARQFAAKSDRYRVTSSKSDKGWGVKVL